MEVKILTKSEEPLLSRVKVEGEVAFDAATPSKNDVRASIAKSMKKDAGLVEISVIETGYGQHKAKVVSYVYESTDMIAKANKLGRKAREKIQKVEEEKKKAEEEAKKEKEASAQAQAAEEAKQKEAEEKAAEKEASSEKSSEQAPADEKQEEAKAEEKKD